MRVLCIMWMLYIMWVFCIMWMLCIMWVLCINLTTVVYFNKTSIFVHDFLKSNFRFGSKNLDLKFDVQVTVQRDKFL